tara:strand:+ start:2356 stop:2544 length:189 start_codon:yes stop_codon:yes gene_type:complete
MHRKIIQQIENVRKKNNKNWMNLLRLAFDYAPKKAAKILKKINSCDKEINSLVGKLSKNHKK